MCDSSEEVGISGPSEHTRSNLHITLEQQHHESSTMRPKLTLEEILERADTVPIDYSKKLLASEPSAEDYAEYLCTLPGWNRSAVGFVGYGKIPRAARALIAVHNTQDSLLAEVIARQLKKNGARVVDIMVIDEGDDHDLSEDEEPKVIIRREGWWINPRRWDYNIRVYNYAAENRYDLVIHGRGGSYPGSSPDGKIKYEFRAEAIPWQSSDEFLNKATIFPPKLHTLINIKTWNLIYKKGRGGKVRLTDPEGTDLEFSLFEKYFERSHPALNFTRAPNLGHLFSHPAPPILEEADTIGEIAGTTAHFGRPFPRIRVEVEAGSAKNVIGGGLYGDRWRELLEETSGVQYPGYPRKGLFWVWEMAIGTNVKIRRASNYLRYKSGSFEWERRRSGVIHCGLGTSWQQHAELWAATKGIAYGHLHVHFLFPTYEIKATNGETVKVIENGRLTALDDPEVRELASRYGDPDEILSEDWIPKVPGITDSSASYQEYAEDPCKWILKLDETRIPN
jgi:hypothetical protein